MASSSAAPSSCAPISPECKQILLSALNLNEDQADEPQPPTPSTVPPADERAQRLRDWERASAARARTSAAKLLDDTSYQLLASVTQRLPDDTILQRSAAARIPARGSPTPRYTTASSACACFVPRSHSYEGTKITVESTSLVGLTWPGGKRAVVALTQRLVRWEAWDTDCSDCSETYLEPRAPDAVFCGISLYVVNEKKKPQPCYAQEQVKIGEHVNRVTHRERTNSGLVTLHRITSGIGVRGLDETSTLTLLIAGAQAAASQLGGADSIDYLASSIKIAKTKCFGEKGSGRAVSIGFHGVQLLAWRAARWEDTADAQSNGPLCEQPTTGASTADVPGASTVDTPTVDAPTADAAMADASTASKRKAKAQAPKAEKKAKTKAPSPWTDATLQLAQALQAFIPPEEMARPKAAFKMAKVVEPASTGVDRSAAWGGGMKALGVGTLPPPRPLSRLPRLQS